jgi:hypothetical protein
VVEARAAEIRGETVKEENVCEESYELVQQKGYASGDEPNASS